MIAQIVNDLRRHWKTMVLVDLTYKFLAFVVLAPLVGLLFSLSLQVSGRSVLADDDILRFILSPYGCLTMIVVGAVAIGTAALEQAALMTVLASSPSSGRPQVRRVLCYTAARWPAISRVAAYLVGLTLLIALPYLLLALAVYRWRLSEFDINYYMQAQPKEWWQAIGLGVVIVVALLFTVVPRWVERMMALPIVLFEGQRGINALRLSRSRTRPRRWQMLACLVAWFVLAWLVSVAATGLIGVVGGWAVKASSASLKVTVVVAGIVVCCATLGNLIATLFSHLTLASLLMTVYRQWGSEQPVEPLQLSKLQFTGEPARRLLHLNRRVLIALCVLTLIVATVAGIGLLNRVNVDANVEIVAHRGASHAAPENTLAAIELAIEEGADWVEFDVQETKDGVVVVAHDSDLMKVGGGPTKIWEGTASDFADKDIGSWFGPQFSDQRVPTLAEVLQRCRGRIRLTIELKYYGHNDQLEQRVIDLVESHQMANDVVIISLKQPLLDRTKQLRPTWTVGLLTAAAVGNLHQAPVDFLAVSASLASRPLIHAAHQQGKQVHVWTVNDPVTMSTMISRGVDRIITDRPAMARSVLQQRRQMSLLERLLIEFAGAIGASPRIDLTAEDA